MNRVIQFAWLWLSFNVIVFACWVAIADCIQRGKAPIHRGQSWERQP